MKKKLVTMLALLLAVCLLAPTIIKQGAAEGAVQVTVTAKNGSVMIGSTTVSDGSSTNVEENTSPTIKAIPADGYAFAGWSVTGGTLTSTSETETTLTVTTEAVTLTATFQKLLTVTLNQAEGGTATITATEHAVSSTATTVTGLDDSSGNMVATLKATPADGYAFAGWTAQYVKANGSTATAKAKEDRTSTAGAYQYVRPNGKATDSEISVGFCENNTKMFVSYHASLVFTPKYSKLLDMTIQSTEGGTVTSSDTLTGLASGSSATFTATPNTGYGLLDWTVTDAEGNATTDYTLKTTNNTATLTLKNTSLKISAIFSQDAGQFVVDPTETNPPSVQLRSGTTGIGTTTVTGWNNNKNDALVMTVVPTADPRTIDDANLYIAVWKLAASGYAAGTTLQFSENVDVADTSSDSYKQITFKAGSTAPWEEDITFTITDANGKVKQGKIVIDYPSQGTVSIEGTGKVKINGKEYASSDVVKAITGAELKLEAAEAAAFAGWESTGITLTEEQAKANPLTITAPEGTFTIKAKFQTGDSDNTTIRVKLMESEIDRSAQSFWTESVGINTMFQTVLMGDKDFDTLVAGGFYGIADKPTAVDDNYNVFTVRGGEAVCVKVLDFRQKLTGEKKGYVLESLTSDIPEADIIGKKTVDEKINGIDYKVTYLAFYAKQNVTVTGSIHELHNVNITAASNDAAMGSVEMNPSSSNGIYKERATVLISAIPKDGYKFKNWTETGGSYLSESQKNSLTVQLVAGTSNTQLTANFEEGTAAPLPVTIKVDYSEKATVKVNGESNVTSASPGTQLTAAISNIDEYYLFDHWEITQNGVENADPLFPDTDKKNTSVTFTMPSNPQGITIHAIMKERRINVGAAVYLNNVARTDLATVAFSVNGEAASSMQGSLKKGDTCSFSVTLTNPNDYVLKSIELFRNETKGQFRQFITTDSSGSFCVDDWYYSYVVWVHLEEKTADNARYNITLTQPTSGGTISSSNQTAQSSTTVTLTATPQNGCTLKQWIVKDASGQTIKVTAGADNTGTFTMPKSNVTVTAEFSSATQLTPEITAVALLNGSGGTQVAAGAQNGDAWEVQIPATVSADTVNKIPEGTSGFYLKIVAPAGVTVKQIGGKGQYEGDWSKGDIMCYMPVNEEVAFQAIAGTATKDYTIKLIYAETDKPTLSAGSATRTGKTGATVTFTSSEAGSYYYKLVTKGVAASTIDTTGSGDTASVGSNTITLTNLTEDARDIYIVVKNANDVVSDSLKVEIPAYSSGSSGGGETTDEGDFTISISCPTGGTITVSHKKANKGDVITVTATPDSGYQLEAGSLKYGFASSGAEMLPITDGKFTMPAGNVNITCKWETASVTTTGITAFSINGVSAAVNNTANVITITLPRGTDVTKLMPVISTSGVKSLSPASGKTVDFTNSVTYTATMDDGTTKTYTVTVYVDKGSLADQFWDKLTDFYNQTPWWEYAKTQQSTSKYPKYW